MYQSDETPSQLKPFKYYKNDYTPGKILGTGAFGETRLIHDKKNNSTYVLKRIPKEKTDKKMLLNEVNILRHLQDVCGPHLLCYVDYEDDPTDTAYTIITEYLGPYVTLESFIKNTSDKDRWAVIRPVFTNLLLGLQDLHNANVAQRDLKPSNILFNPKNNAIKIIDFGLSCYAKECDTAPVAGTAIYMSPEMSRGNSFNLSQYEKLDIWSLAVTMLEYILGMDNFDRAWDAVKSAPNILKILPRAFTRNYPDIVLALKKMLVESTNNRALPTVTFK
jgi:serine/threonine protein kinase